MDKRFEELKRVLFECGRDDIDEFVGFEIDFHEDKAVIESYMDEVYEQMPDELLEEFYEKFCIIIVR